MEKKERNENEKNKNGKKKIYIKRRTYQVQNQNTEINIR